MSSTRSKSQGDSRRVKTEENFRVSWQCNYCMITFSSEKLIWVFFDEPCWLWKFSQLSLCIQWKLIGGHVWVVALELDWWPMVTLGQRSIKLLLNDTNNFEVFLLLSLRWRHPTKPQLMQLEIINHLCCCDSLLLILVFVSQIMVIFVCFLFVFNYL